MAPTSDPAQSESSDAALPSDEPRGKVLVADDDDQILRLCVRVLSAAGYQVVSARDGQEAVELLRAADFDTVLSDIVMPGMDGLQLLRLVRERDLDVPVILMTAGPTLETAIRAVELGALRYLEKPVSPIALEKIIEQAVRLGRMARLKRQALELVGPLGKRLGDKAGLEATLDRALKSLWMAFQPIVRWSTREIFGYEALVRTEEANLAVPENLLDAAERLGRLHDVGRAVRDSVAGSAPQAPSGACLFVNLHTMDLVDETLFAPGGQLARCASRVFFEITERASLDWIKDVRWRVASLRKLGYRVAIDDLGAGYAGLSSFAQVEPEVIKLDMSLVRDVDRSPTKQKLVASMITLCRELGILVICEGVETVRERDTLVELGSDYFQGFLFAGPGRPFVGVTF